MSGPLDVLIADGVIDEVLGRLKSGKEADISLVRRGEAVIAAKVYKDRATRSFKNNADYKEGRKVRNSRSQRAMESGSKFGRDAAEQAWKSAEADALFKLANAGGVRVPTPILFYEGVLLMDVVADAEGRPAQRLIDVAIERDAALGIYADLCAQIIAMLCCDLIHGDLSPYNILAGAAGPTIIDFPQVVSAAHSTRAEFFFQRDFDNVVRFLAGFDPALAPHTADGRAIWRAYTSRELTPQFVPPPPPPPRQTRGPDRRGPRPGPEAGRDFGRSQGSAQPQQGRGPGPQQRGPWPGPPPQGRGGPLPPPPLHGRDGHPPPPPHNHGGHPPPPHNHGGHPPPPGHGGPPPPPGHGEPPPGRTSQQGPWRGPPPPQGTWGGPPPGPWSGPWSGPPRGQPSQQSRGPQQGRPLTPPGRGPQQGRPPPQDRPRPPAQDRPRPPAAPLPPPKSDWAVTPPSERAPPPPPRAPKPPPYVPGPRYDPNARGPAWSSRPAGSAGAGGGAPAKPGGPRRPKRRF